MSKECEALLKIKDFVNKLTPILSKMNKFEVRHSYIKILEFATQALAPQECDVTKCKFYCSHPNYKGLCLAHCRKEIALKGKHAQDTYCKWITNCYYKQLHSQQKTFTVEEVKNIIQKIYFKYGFMGEERVNLYINCLLAEFEKEVINV